MEPDEVPKTKDAFIIQGRSRILTQENLENDRMNAGMLSCRSWRSQRVKAKSRRR